MPGAALPPGAQVTYSQQYRRCGKAACSRCVAGGRGHGPYWYAYWWEGGRQRSRYVGKHAPAKIAERGAADVVVVAPLRVRTLGGFAVWRGAALIAPDAWTSRRAAALLLCLVSTPGHRMLREQACELLWPETDPAAGAANLRTTIHLLRQVLDGPGATMSYLRTDGNVLVLAPAGAEVPATDWLDATTFARAAQKALAGQDGDACRAALAQYGGDYLPDETYAAWAEQPRASLRRHYVDLLLHMATVSGARGAVEEAEDCLRRVLVAEPSHEGAAATLMALLAASGRRGEALYVYQRLATVLEEDLAVAPSAEIATLRARLLAQEAAPLATRVPPRAQQPARLTNVPLALTSFVGRLWDVPAVVEEVTAARLVTLTGPGGCGKTRLALEVAARLVEAYADGVWLVELAALADPALVPRALAGALGVVEGAGRSAHDALVEFLRPREILVVVDNCEHLIGACAELATLLLQTCPHLRLLATSRERLEVAGEQSYLVPSLAAPDPEHLPPLERLATYEAVQLFVERARAQRSDVTLTAANAGAIAQVCARLDGLPLAIELAAARVGVLPVEGIAARLDDCFRLLTGGPRTALPRQQTLRATLEWSHELLTDPERVLLRRLAAFAGGCTLTAAAAVCADPSAPHLHGARGIRDGAVLDLLSGLVQKSLVQLEESRGEPRYRLLETVRQYGLERLVGSGEEAALRQQHADYFVVLAERAAAEPPPPGQTSWFEELGQEHDNLRGALRWLLDADQGEQALQMALRLWTLWDMGCYYAEGQRWLEGALAKSGRSPAALRARGCSVAAALAAQRGEFTQASALGEEAVRLSRAAGDKGGLASGLMMYGYAALQLEAYATAQGLLDESLTVCSELYGPQGRIGPLHFLSELALNQGQYDEAVALAEESVALSRTHGDGRGLLAHRLGNLARGLLARGDLQEAIPLSVEGLLVSQEHGDMRHLAYHLEGLAGAAAQQARPRRAAHLAGAAQGLRQEINSPLSVPEAAIVELLLSPARRPLDTVAWDAAWHEGAALTLDQAIAYALQGESEMDSYPA